jgi:hypothetical protein
MIPSLAEADSRPPLAGEAANAARRQSGEPSLRSGRPAPEGARSTKSR